MMSNRNWKNSIMIAIIITATVWLNAMVMAFDIHNPITLPSTIASLARHGRQNSPRGATPYTSERLNKEGGRQQPFVCARTNSFATKQNYSTTSSTLLFMGIADFFKPRQDDFVKLELTESAYGPGPVILFFNVPDGISNNELNDMIEDGAPSASKLDGGVKYQRYVSEDLSGTLVDGTVAEILELALQQSPPPPLEDLNVVLPITTGIISTPQIDDEIDASSAPILYFSGVTNKEMMQTYNIIAREIFDETGGIAACAKAVKPAMSKSFRQLLTEIAGDHSEATAGAKTSDS